MAHGHIPQPVQVVCQFFLVSAPFDGAFNMPIAPDKKAVTIFFMLLF